MLAVQNETNCWGRVDVFYNEIDEYACRWLRNLVDAGHIAAGVGAYGNAIVAQQAAEWIRVCMSAMP